MRRFDAQPALVLVDLNNVDPTAKTEPTVRDVLDLLSVLIRGVLFPPGRRSSRTALDVECRLYDGWIDRVGTKMEKYRLVDNLRPESLEGLASGIRVNVTLVTSLAAMPGAELRGTYINRGQKMVDQMLAQDLAFYCRDNTYGNISLIASDADYTPVALSVPAERRPSFTWLRARAEGLNDDHLLGAMISPIFDGRWAR